MAPLPSNLTQRVFFDYVTGNEARSKEHTASLRTAGTLTTVDNVQAAFLAVLNAFGANNFATGWRVNQVRYQEAGTNFSLPVATLAGLASFVGTGGLSPNNLAEATEETFQARSTVSGRRTDFSLYRARNVPDNTFRIQPGATGLPLAVQTAVNALNSAATAGTICGIDGTSIRFAAYMNQNVNSYWERRQRS